MENESPKIRSMCEEMIEQLIENVFTVVFAIIFQYSTFGLGSLYVIISKEVA